ncbi:decarboxylase [bacterium]|nr:MAG: decarboxylase [bacterium]
MKGFAAKARKVLAKRDLPLPREAVIAHLAPNLARAEDYKRLAEGHGTPLIVFDEENLLRRAERFRSVFSARIENFRPHFAVKSNNHPFVSRGLASIGYGLDVSSGVELSMALETGCDSILFTGPGKTLPELALAVENHPRVTVLADSFGELERLSTAAKSAGKTVTIGVRLTNDTRGLWRKFGIPSSRLGEFISLAEKLGNVEVRGIHFHTSWNMNPSAQVNFIGRVGNTLKKLGKARAGMLEFLDIGGGYWPERGEWLNAGGTERGKLLSAAGIDCSNGNGPFLIPAAPVEEFAGAIGAALEEHVFPLARPQVYAEPGRWVCDDAMQVLLTVLDKKGGDLVIADGGTNIVGLDKFETDYCPVVNLSRPSRKTSKCLVTGSLCTPHDIWGFEVEGEPPEPGDLLLVTAVGAYTWSLRQEFIKPLAKVVKI